VRRLTLPSSGPAFGRPLKSNVRRHNYHSPTSLAPTKSMKLSLPTFVASCALLLTGCSTYQPVPKEYTGPTATLQDSGFAEDGTKAQVFAAKEIDGSPIMNAFRASEAASRGRGASLTAVFPERKVKAVPMKVTLEASHATGAPIAAIASQMAGTFFSVKGVVDFTPRPDGKYIVKGELRKEKSSVWIEDVETGKPVTTVVSSNA